MHNITGFLEVRLMCDVKNDRSERARCSTSFSPIPCRSWAAAHGIQMDCFIQIHNHLVVDYLP